MKTMTINEYCAQWRVNNGLKQKEIGEKVGADYTQVSAFERGNSRSGRVLCGYLLAGMVDFGDVEVVYNGKEKEADCEAEA